MSQARDVKTRQGVLEGVGAAGVELEDPLHRDGVDRVGLDGFGGEVTDETLSYQGPFASCDDCLEAAVDSEITVLTDLSIDGTNLVAATQTLVIRDGKIVGVCDSDEIRLEGTDCPEDTTSGSEGGV